LKVFGINAQFSTKIYSDDPTEHNYGFFANLGKEVLKQIKKRGAILSA